MSTNESALIYQNITRICRIGIPVMYLFVAVIALLAVGANWTIFTQETFTNNDRVIDLTALAMHSKIFLAIIVTTALGFAVRFTLLLVKVAKNFKAGEIFSESTAKLANFAALNLLVTIMFGWVVNFTTSIFTGNLSIGVSSEIITIAFAYLFAWVLSIGSKVKAENDMTI